MIGFGSKRTVTAVSAGLMAGLMSTGAWAQVNCAGVTVGPIPNVAAVAAPAASAAGSISGAIGNISTAFLQQQGSAFVSAPANPAPDQPGGGVWVRGVAGEVTLKSTTTANAAVTSAADPTLNTTSAINCNNNQRSTFEGGQVGTDISRLNWNGWNVHLGTTAGYLSSTTRDNAAGFRTSFEVPFLGTYLVATYGRFFADVLVRQEFYDIRVNNPGSGFFNQQSGAHGYSIATSAGYNFALANNWFIEPSAGFNYTRTKVDSATVVGSPLLPISGIASSNDIESQLGRVSVRVGTTIATPTMIWQPFASASVFHEFAGNVNSSFVSLPNNAFVGATPVVATLRASTTRVGTYGQYSLGLAGQIVNTGWLGFVRVDYRNGDRIDGYTGNVGLRYQFTPEVLAAVMPTKVPVKARPFIGPTNWTGFFIGGFFGVDAGRTDVGFTGASNARPYVFGPLGGGQIGYNWQGASPWVFGIEGDIGAADKKGGRSCGTANGLTAGGAPQIGTPAGFAPAYFTCRDDSDWVATATARVGYSLNRTLYYVRGGGAWEDSTVSANCILGTPNGITADGSRACVNQVGAVTTNSSTSHTRTGYLIGFGTEFDLGRNWSAKSEINYIDYGRRTALASDGVTSLTERASTSQVKIGVNYRFGGPSAVVAKY